MQIILASAKIMHDQLKSMPNVDMTTPRFQNEAAAFARDMASYPIETIAEMLGCSQAIATQNKLRFMHHLEDAATMPAILAYHGQAYKHLKAETLTAEHLNFSQQHLWIMSFLYGILRPLDGILPYRMEGNVLTDVLINSIKADDGVLIHLATEEFQHLLDWQRVNREVRIVQPLFYVKKGNALKMQAVWAKTCRGAMTRFIIENQISNPSLLQAFSYEGFHFNPSLGDENHPHFVKQ